jgi:RimJ/RimL family protein N-acetyltransferase
MSGSDSLEVEAALEAERQFVLTLGGFNLEIAGAHLVTHERLPVPRFNFVETVGVGAERQSAFFERALDHYFQRALRPSFRIPVPVPGHLEAGLRRFGFRPREPSLVLLLGGGDRARPTDPPSDVRLALPSELDLVASFWTSERERPEFRAALDVAWNHPNPQEQLQPILAFSDGEAISVGIVYRYRRSAGIHAVATRSSARGRGAASEVVEFALAHELAGPGVRYSIFANSERLQQGLERLGFLPARSFREYELPADAELAIAPPGPPGPPQWRPPREKGSGSA